MRTDALTAAAGVGFEASTDVESVLVETAEQFLRAGGRLTLPEWAALSPESRAALATAGDRIRTELAAMIPLSELAMRGESSEDAQMEQALRKVAGG